MNTGNSFSCNCMKGFTGNRCETNIDDGGACSGCYSNDSDKPCPASCELTIISMLNITKTLSKVYRC